MSIGRHVAMYPLSSWDPSHRLWLEQRWASVPRVENHPGISALPRWLQRRCRSGYRAACFEREQGPAFPT